MSDFTFNGNKWRRDIELGDAQMDTIKLKISNELLLISYDMNVSDGIITHSTRSFPIPVNTKTDQIKATMSKNKLSIHGELTQFKSEMNIKLG